MDNPRADRVRAVARLATAAGRQRAGEFLVEGPHAVLDLLRAALVAASRWRVVAVYATPGARDRTEVNRLAAAAGHHVVEVSDRVMAAMSDAESPQGVLAVAAVPGDHAAAGIELPAAGFGAVLVAVQDPGNVGTVIRAGDAAGAAVVALTPGCADPFAPKVVRSTAGSLFHIPVRPVRDAGHAIASARHGGWRVFATAADGSMSLDDLSDAASRRDGPLVGPHLWLLGNEAHGLPAEVTALADEVVRIPFRGRAESLNLAMAATLVLFASARQRSEPVPPG